MATTLAQRTLANLQARKVSESWYQGGEAAQLQVQIDNLVNEMFTAYGNQSKAYTIAKAWKAQIDKAIVDAPVNIAEINALIADIND